MENIAGALAHALTSLRLTQTFTFITSVMLVLFLRTMSADSEGYCDTENVESRASFGMLLFIQLVLFMPTLYYFHNVSLIDYVDRSTEFADREEWWLGIAFLLFCSSSALILVVLVDTFLNGPSSGVLCTWLLLFSVLLFCASITGSFQFERSRT